MISLYSDVNKSLGEVLALSTGPDRDELLHYINELLSPEEQITFAHSWQVWGRPSQQAPDYCMDPNCSCGGDWTLWLVLAGRGWGKSRTGSEWVHEVAYKYPGCKIGLIGPTSANTRQVMIEGDSGLISTMKPWNPCEYWPSKLEFTFANGSVAYVISADEPNRLRGLQYHFVWCDELCAWAKAEEVWQMMRLGLRLPTKVGWPRYRPRVVITTTPKPTPFILQLAGRSKPKPSSTHITKGNTDDNKANLAQEFYDTIIADLRGTRLGRQELEGEILSDVPGALWRHEMIDPFRIEPDALPDLRKVVVAIDPAAGGDNATGIIVCGTGHAPGESEIKESHISVASSLKKNQRIHGYVVADLSLHGSPDQWARAAVRAFHDFGANEIVAEANQGGEMVRYTIHTVDSSVPVRLVHATRNKKTRAEPIVALFEQGRIHMTGKLPHLEEQLLTWDPEISASPDRLDAMVWGLHHLLGKGKIHHPTKPIQLGTRATSGWAFMRTAA